MRSYGILIGPDLCCSLAPLRDPSKARAGAPEGEGRLAGRRERGEGGPGGLGGGQARPAEPEEAAQRHRGSAPRPALRAVAAALPVGAAPSDDGQRQRGPVGGGGGEGGRARHRLRDRQPGRHGQNAHGLLRDGPAGLSGQRQALPASDAGSSAGHGPQVPPGILQALARQSGAAQVAGTAPEGGRAVAPPTGEHTGRHPAVPEGAGGGGEAGREVLPTPQRGPPGQAEDHAGVRPRLQLAPQPRTQQAGEGGVQDEGHAVGRARGTRDREG